MLLQEGQPYSTRSLTSAEQNYTQIEKEMLANIVGYEKFDQYIYGRKAFVETDHKPLVSITSSQCFFFIFFFFSHLAFQTSILPFPFLSSLLVQNTHLAFLTSKYSGTNCLICCSTRYLLHRNILHKILANII